MLAHQVFFNKMITTVGADIAVTRKQLAVGQAGAQVERVNIGHALGADDAVDGDDRLFAGTGIVAAMKNSDLAPGLPAYLARRVVNHGLFK